MGLGPVNEQKRRERLERLAKVADGYLKCKPAHEIAKELGVHVRLIYLDFSKLREIWAKKAEAGAKAYIASELAKLERIEREAWEMHERAKKVLKQQTESLTDTEKGSYSTVSKTRRSAEPPSRWLEVILKCMDKRAMLLKLHDPEVNEAGVMRAMVLEVVVENPDQVQQIMSYEKFRNLTSQPVPEPEALIAESES